MKDSKLRNVTAVIARILQILAFVGAFSCIAVSIFLPFSKDSIEEGYDSGHITFEASGFTATIFDEAGHFLLAPALSVIVAVALACILMGLIFRNIYQIFKKSNTGSPFSDDNIRMIKQIGIYAILIPVMKLVVTIFSVIIVGSNGFQASVSLMEVAFGLVVLCLAQYFAYGAQLEKDVDGLV